MLMRSMQLVTFLVGQIRWHALRCHTSPLKPPTVVR